MQKMIATTKLTYAGRDLAAGDHFDASEEDAFILANIGKASAVDDAADKAPTPPDAAGVGAGSKEGRKPNRYGRRDMRAKD